MRSGEKAGWGFSIFFSPVCSIAAVLFAKYVVWDYYVDELICFDLSILDANVAVPGAFCQFPGNTYKLW